MGRAGEEGGGVKTVAALYIDPRGPYPKMAGVDCWDADRDAENYAGPWPVVAHPPCAPWGRLKHFATKDSPALGLVAFAQVRRWGGVLEHPADATLFAAAGALRPGNGEDSWGGRTLMIDQCNFGHVARKRTWLYLVGVPRLFPRDFPPRREPTHSICNGRGKQLADGTVRLRATAKQARLTPLAFAEWLVELARGVELRSVA